MIQQFLTIKEAAERLKDKGYDVDAVEACVREKKVPHHFRDGKFLIPFPEAEPFFVEIPKEPTPAEEKPTKAPARATKKATK